MRRPQERHRTPIFSTMPYNEATVTAIETLATQDDLHSMLSLLFSYAHPASVSRLSVISTIVGFRNANSSAHKEARCTTARACCMGAAQY